MTAILEDAQMVQFDQNVTSCMSIHAGCGEVISAEKRARASFFVYREVPKV